jgi:hypothetical protein
MIQHGSIQPESFSSYPPEGKALAMQSIEILRQVPTPLLPVFLQELKTYDWQFPNEQLEIRRRLAFVQANPNSVSGFSRISVPPHFLKSENIAVPQRFVSEMSAYLWSSLQMDAYREAAAEFMRLYQAADKPIAPNVPRLVVLVIGQGATGSPELFQKLSSHGQIRTNVRVEGGVEAILDAVARRSANHPEPYAHWYIDGGDPLPGVPDGCTRLAWPALASMNQRVLELIQSCIAKGSGPEALQEQMAELPLRNVSADQETDDPRLRQFALSLFTEESGTQIFSTTFVQAAIREVLRRAQPITLLARFAPRQRQRSFNAMVENVIRRAHDLDPEGSLVDADMAAYYAYLELMQLPGGPQASLLVWFEGHPLAFAAGPRIPRDTYSPSACTIAGTLSDLLADG